MSKSILIRVDANRELGMGHCMRCLLLADELAKRGYTITFVLQKPPTQVSELIQTRGHRWESLDRAASQDSAVLKKLIKKTGAEILILDGYHFRPAYFDSLQNIPVFILDDGIRQEIPPHVHLTSPIDSKVYGSSGASIKAGSRFALINPEIRNCKFKLKKEFKKGFVFMGGSDPCGMIGWIATQYIPKSLQLTIIVGAIDSLKSTIKSDQIQLVSFQKSPWEHYVSGDAALVAGGSICWEMAYLGVPMVLVQTAENQSALIRCFVDNHAAHLAGPESEIKKSNNLFAHHFCEDSLSFEMRKSLSSRASEMVDGYGLERVIAFILNEPFWIRRAQLSDKQITFDLANDLETRKNSFVSKPIIWEEHEEWFLHRLNKDKSPFYILVDESEQVMSVVRFDFKQDGDYVVSVNLSPDFRGRGQGTLVLTETLRQLKTDFYPKNVRAVIKNDNEASRRAFMKAGFVNKGNSKDYGIEASEYVYTYED